MYVLHYDIEVSDLHGKIKFVSGTLSTMYSFEMITVATTINIPHISSNVGILTNLTIFCLTTLVWLVLKDENFQVF